MRWHELTETAPRLAALGREKLEAPGVVLVGTIRRDGTARISPVEPLLWEGDLWLSMLWGSLKARDLVRDDRLTVHSIITGRDGSGGEVKIRGRALAEDSLDVQARYAEEAHRRLGWRPVPGRFHLFRVELDDVTFIRYDDPTGDQYVAQWPRGDEFVRRGTSATSLGERESWSELLDDERP